MEGSAGGQRLAESKYQASAEIGTNKETGLHKGDRTKNNETCRYQTHSIATSRLTWPARMKGEHTQFSAGQVCGDLDLHEHRQHHLMLIILGVPALRVQQVSFHTYTFVTAKLTLQTKERKNATNMDPAHLVPSSRTPPP
eukprot:1154023-Pelagomonas_calceolata.AAC.2